MPHAPGDRCERGRQVSFPWPRIGTELSVCSGPYVQACGNGFPEVFGVAEAVEAGQGPGAHLVEGLEQVAGDGVVRGHRQLPDRWHVRRPLIADGQGQGSRGSWGTTSVVSADAGRRL